MMKLNSAIMQPKAMKPKALAPAPLMAGKPGMAMPANAPPAKNSRTMPIRQRAPVKPRPIERPSSALYSGGLQEAKLSARARMMQLTTMRAMNACMVSYRSGRKRRMTICTMMTKVEMMTM